MTPTRLRGLLFGTALGFSVTLGAISPGNAQSEDPSYRVMAMEEQMRQLVGQVEVLSHRIEVLEKKLDALPQAGLAPSGNPPSANPRGALAPPLSSTTPSNNTPSLGGPAILEVDPPAQSPSLTKAPGPHPLGTLPSSGTENTPSLTREPEASSLDSLTPEGVDSSPLQNPSFSGSEPLGQNLVPETLYEQAYEDYLSQRFEEAQRKFTFFLARSPEHDYAGRSHYWLGEIFFRKGAFKDAARHFLSAYQKDPKGIRGPDSLFRLGISLLKLGQPKQACGAFSEVLRKYPKATAIRSQATSELKRGKCG